MRRRPPVNRRPSLASIPTEQWEVSQDTSTMLSTFHRLHAAFTVLKSIALSASGDAKMAHINTARARWEQRKKKEPDVIMAEPWRKLGIWRIDRNRQQVRVWWHVSELEFGAQQHPKFNLIRLDEFCER